MDVLGWCRERMLVPGQPLAASLLFVDGADRDVILVIRSLAAELLQLLDGPPEPELLSARLNWWQGVLAGQAEHPALAALAALSPRAGITLPQPAAFLPLLSAVAQADRAVRFERFEELWQQSRSLGGQVAAIEFSLYNNSSSGNEAARELGAAGWLLRRVRDIARDAGNHRWIVPLDLQAQFQVARQDVVEARGGPGWAGLVRTLVERALRSGNSAAEQLGSDQRHLKILWAVEKRLAGKLAARPEKILERRLLPRHAGNVWVAWREARRVSA